MSLNLKNSGLGIPLLLVILFMCSAILVNAQEDKDKDKGKEQTLINYDEPDFLLDQDSIDVIKKKKKKRKKKTFNGLKTKRGFTKKGSGRKTTVELFYYLKKYREPDPYVSLINLFDIQKLKIVHVRNYNTEKYPPKRFKILHGPYKMTRDTITLVEGYYYTGMKHHRWSKYNRNEILLEKKKYHKGFPAESILSYYDTEHKKLKEVIPYEYGEKTGPYVSYFDNGTVKEKGVYERGIKVGKWTEYYKPRHRPKQITEHAEDGYDLDYKPVILKQWDKEGNMTVGTSKRKKKSKRGSLGRGR